MSEPIISPWIIYIGGMLPSLNAICFTGLLFFGVMLLVCLMENIQTVYKKYIFIGLTISLLMCIVIPSQRTYYAMVVANYVTYENINVMVYDNIENILNKIIETAKKIKEK